MNKIKSIGKIDKRVVDITENFVIEGKEILLGETNIEHMKKNHPEDYEKYGDKIEEIVNKPDYIAKHPRKDSIEYIKVYKDSKEDYVLVAVRVTGKGTLFARTLFVMSDEKVEKYFNKNALKKY